VGGGAILDAGLSLAFDSAETVRSVLFRVVAENDEDAAE